MCIVWTFWNIDLTRIPHADNRLGSTKKYLQHDVLRGASLKPTEIEIEVIKYTETFTMRAKDIKNLRWFSFPHDLLLHPDFLDITGEELKWFIWTLSVCVKCKQSKIRMNIPHAVRFLSLTEKDFFSMCEKLQGKQILTDGDQAATKRRPNGGLTAAPTEQNITLQDITKQDTTPAAADLCLRCYELWPLKKGKSAGLKRLAKEIKSESDVTLFETAARKYLTDLRDMKFCKHFSTFANEWKDWIDFVPNSFSPNSPNKSANVFETARQQLLDIEAGKI